MKDIKITFVGGGHMGRALIGGLIAGGTAPQNITVADPDDSQRSALEQDLEVNTNADSAAAVNGADIAVLAVKPQIMDAVLEQLAPAISADRKSTRLNSSHVAISYAVFCLNKKKKKGYKRLQSTI